MFPDTYYTRFFSRETFSELFLYFEQYTSVKFILLLQCSRMKSLNKSPDLGLSMYYLGWVHKKSPWLPWKEMKIDIHRAL